MTTNAGIKQSRKSTTSRRAVASKSSPRQEGQQRMVRRSARIQSNNLKKIAERNELAQKDQRHSRMQESAPRDISNPRGNNNTATITTSERYETRGTKRKYESNDAPLDRNVKQRITKENLFKSTQLPSSPPVPFDNEEPWQHGPRLSTLRLPGTSRVTSNPAHEPDSELTDTELSDAEPQLGTSHVPSTRQLEASSRGFFPKQPLVHPLNQQNLPPNFRAAKTTIPEESVQVTRTISVSQIPEGNISFRVMGNNNNVVASVFHHPVQPVGGVSVQTAGQQHFQQGSVRVQQQRFPPPPPRPLPKARRLQSKAARRYVPPHEDAHRQDLSSPENDQSRAAMYDRRDVPRGRGTSSQVRSRDRSRSPARGHDEDQSANPLRDRAEAREGRYPTGVRIQGRTQAPDGREGYVDTRFDLKSGQSRRIEVPAPVPRTASSTAATPLPGPPSKSQHQKTVDALKQLLHNHDFASPDTYHRAVANVLAALPDTEPTKNSTIFTDTQFIATSMKVQCSFCGDNLPASQTTSFECGCTFCGPCLVRAFNSMLSIDGAKPPICGCRREIPLADEVRNLMTRTLFTVDDKSTPDTAVFEKLVTQYKRAASKRCAAKIYHCHACNLYIEDTGTNVNTTSRSALCNNPQCGNSTCLFCRNASHAGPCPTVKDDQMLDQMIKLNHLCKCPTCGTIIEKIDLCNHIGCEGCGADLCYYCGRKYDEDTCDDHLAESVPTHKKDEVLKSVDSSIPHAALKKKQDVRGEAELVADPRKCQHTRWMRTTKGVPIAKDELKRERCRECLEEYLWFHECVTCGLGGVCAECLHLFEDGGKEVRRR